MGFALVFFFGDGETCINLSISVQHDVGLNLPVKSAQTEIVTVTQKKKRLVGWSVQPPPIQRTPMGNHYY